MAYEKIIDWINSNIENLADADIRNDDEIKKKREEIINASVQSAPTPARKESVEATFKRAFEAEINDILITRKDELNEQYQKEVKGMIKASEDADDLNKIDVEKRYEESIILKQVIGRRKTFLAKLEAKEGERIEALVEKGVSEEDAIEEEEGITEQLIAEEELEI